MSRLKTAALVLLSHAAAAGAGCGSSRLDCGMSAAAYCASEGPASCAPTWDDVQRGQQMCWTNATYEISDCGGTHELLYADADTAKAYYYDAATGQLTAVVLTSAVGQIQQSCVAGPADGFAVPRCVIPDGGAPLDCGAPEVVAR